MSFKPSRAAALLALCLPLPATAAVDVDVEILDRQTGRILPVYWHAGERHVAGEPGREYEIRLSSREGGRILAVTSVDGVNVVTGRTASPAQGGYVLDPWESIAIDGWRKSLREVAAFYFSALPDSYAARTNRPHNVGVIGVALFRERERPMPMEDMEDELRAEAPAAAPSAGASADTVTPQRRSAKARGETRLGTGHGRRLGSGATWTDFERAGAAPEAVVRIYYDSHRNLVARGIAPTPDRRYAGSAPDPFPGIFVPDP